MDKKRVLIVITLVLLVAISSCTYLSSTPEKKDAKQKIREINKIAENATYHTIYSVTQGNISAEMESWQKKDKVKSKLTAMVKNQSITSISMITEEGFFACQAKGNSTPTCIKPKELQEAYAKRTTQAFRDEVLEKINLTQTNDKTIAGEKAQCFLATSGNKFQEICYTDKGVMVYTKQTLKDEIAEIIAKKIDYYVDDSQFKLEGHFLEQA